MHKIFREFDLQFFAEGASGGEGTGGAPSGVSAGNGAAADAGQGFTLEEMGVPAAEIRKYRAMKGKQAQPAAQQPVSEPVPEGQDAAADDQPQEQTEPRRTLKDALKENQEWNREVQSMVRDRVKNTAARLDKAMQILEMVGRDYGVEAENIADLDLDALRQKVEGDKTRYEKAALSHGTDVDTEMRLDQMKRENEAQRRALDDIKREAELQNHYRNLQQQANELRKIFPDFNLDRELENQEFYERTLPGSKDTVKSAYFAIHGEEIANMRAQQAASAAARGASQAMANNIQAGRRMPAENGTVQRAPGTVKATPYSRMSPEQRKDFERRLKAGEYFA